MLAAMTLLFRGPSAPAGGRGSIRLFVALLLLLFSGFMVLPGPARAGESCLRLGTDEWPPYEFAAPDGRIVGLASEVLSSVLARMGVKAEAPASYPWVRGLKCMEGGQLDVLYSSVYDPRRLRFARYPKTPLFQSEWVLFIRKADAGTLGFRTLADLNGHRVGVVRGYSYTPAFNDYAARAKNTVAVSDDRAALELLVRGRVDYALCEHFNGQRLLVEAGLGDVLEPLLAQPLGPLRLYPLFNRCTVSQTFVDRFDRELARFKKSREFGAIVARYLR